jgi:hypothetical protein
MLWFGGSGCGLSAWAALADARLTPITAATGKNFQVNMALLLRLAENLTREEPSGANLNDACAAPTNIGKNPHARRIAGICVSVFTVQSLGRKTVWPSKYDG